MASRGVLVNQALALGLGDNVDYEIIWNSQVFEELIERYHICREELNTGQVVRDERDLVVSILAFLQNESGGERFVTDSSILESFAERFEKKITLGGTSVRAAIAMHKLGYHAALHLVTLNEHVRRLLPPDCPYVCSAQEEGIYPHLIVQFSAGTRIKAADIDICTSRSNRIIYDNDYDNIQMALSPAYRNLIGQAKVFLISGFNAMQDQALLQTRLETLRFIMQALPEDAQVYYEDACFHSPQFSGLVRSALLDRIQIYSMNEDELQGYLGRPLDLLDTQQMYAALHEIKQMIPVPALVVHTRYWALAFGEQAERYARALKGGITMAGTRFIHGDDFTRADYAAAESGPLQAAGQRFAQDMQAALGSQVCCLACIQADESRATTIGLGDAFVGGFLPALLD
jgi:ADP-dependent phosphofructokinase/glucokinase